MAHHFFEFIGVFDEDEWDDNPYRTNSNFNSSLDQRRNLFLNASDLPPSQPSAPDIVINEIAASLSNEPDWLELFNDGNQSVDLSDWEVDGFGPIPGGTVLLAGEYLILTDSVQEFDAAYPNVPNVVIAEIDGGLKGGGELIELITPTGTVVDSVEYSNVAPWPSDPADSDKTLSLFDHDDDNALAASWGISDDNGGTPGVANDTVGGTVAPPPAIVIHEIHYDPASGDDSEFIEFIEFFNAEATAVDLDGFTLEEGVDITFPANTSIPAGGYLVITKSLTDFQAAYPGVAALEWADGSLSNGGEDIQLVSPSGIEVDVVDYDDEGDWPTEPDGGGPSLELIDPALDNADPASWKVSAAIGGSPGAANELVDVTDPVVSSVVSADGDVVPAGLVDVAGSVTDSESGVDRVRVLVRRTDGPSPEWWNGSAWVSNWSWNAPAFDGVGGFVLEDVPVVSGGEYESLVWAWDVAGNLSTPSENGGARQFEAT